MLLFLILANAFYRPLKHLSTPFLRSAPPVRMFSTHHMPIEPFVIKDFAISFFRAGHYREALEYFKQINYQKLKNPEAYYFCMGLVYQNIGDFDKSIEWFKKDCKGTDHHRISYLYLLKGDVHKAVEHLNQINHFYPYVSEISRKLISALQFSLGETTEPPIQKSQEELDGLIKEALGAKEVSIDLQNTIGVLLISKGQIKDGLEWLKKSGYYMFDQRDEYTWSILHLYLD